MKTHSFRIYADIVPHIVSGRKTLEVRTSHAFFIKVEIGDVIIFSSSSMRCKVVDIRHYDDFEAMLKVEDPNKIMPGWTSDQVLNGLRRLYSSCYEALGVVVFEIKVVTQ